MKQHRDVGRLSRKPETKAKALGPGFRRDDEVGKGRREDDKDKIKMDSGVRRNDGAERLPPE